MVVYILVGIGVYNDLQSEFPGVANVRLALAAGRIRTCRNILPATSRRSQVLINTFGAGYVCVTKEREFLQNS